MSVFSGKVKMDGSQPPPIQAFSPRIERGRKERWTTARFDDDLAQAWLRRHRTRCLREWRFDDCVSGVSDNGKLEGEPSHRTVCSDNRSMSRKNPDFECVILNHVLNSIQY
jgi:hypothetical protein